MKYQIGIACGQNSQHYVDFLIDSIIKNTPQLDEVEILLGIDNECISKDSVNDFEKRVPNLNALFFEKDPNKVLSRGHGDIVNKIFPHFNSEFSVLIDCDSAILKFNWLEFLSSKLDQNNIVIGSEYEFGSGRYQNFPNVIFMLFNTKLLKSLDICFKPAEPPRDVGWQMPIKIKEAGYNGIPLKLVSPRQKQTHSMMKFMQSDMRGEEYQLDGVPIASHVGRSFSRTFDDPIVKNWTKRVREWNQSHG